jgi:hypothetical protein
MDQDEKAKRLTEAVHKAGRKALKKRRTPSPSKDSTPLMNIAVAVGPGGGIQVAKEIELVKAALLYADHVTLCSPKLELFASVAALAQLDTQQQIDFIVEMMPIIDPLNPSTIKVVEFMKRLRAKHRTPADILAFNQFKAALPSMWRLVKPEIDQILRQAGTAELQVAIEKGLVDLDILELQGTATDDIVRGFTQRVGDYLQNAHAYPMFDDEAGNLARAGLDEGVFKAAATAMARATNVGIGTGMIARLPAFPDARMENVLEAREELEQYVGKFRRAVSKMRERIHSTALDPGFAEEVDAIFVSEVRAAMEEIQDHLRSSNFLRRVLRLSTDSIGPAALGLAAFQMPQLPALVKIGLTATAELAQAATSWQASSTGRNAARGHELYFLYRTQLRLEG